MTIKNNVFGFAAAAAPPRSLRSLRLRAMLRIAAGQTQEDAFALSLKQSALALFFLFRYYCRS